ncbi:MAG: hypothetical protein ACYDG6_11310 [Thermincolia bacterium]
MGGNNYFIPNRRYRRFDREGACMTKQLKFAVIVSLVLVMIAGSVVYALDSRITLAEVDEQIMYETLIEIDGIGPVLAERCVEYYRKNPDMMLDDFIHVKGIGSQRLALIKKRFK